MLDSLLGDIIHTFKVRQMCMQRLCNILSFVNYSPNRAQMHIINIEIMDLSLILLGALNACI